MFYILSIVTLGFALLFYFSGAAPAYKRGAWLAFGSCIFASVVFVFISIYIVLLASSR